MRKTKDKLMLYLDSEIFFIIPAVFLFSVILFAGLSFLNGNNTYEAATLFGYKILLPKGIFYFSGFLNGLKTVLIYIFSFSLIIIFFYSLFNSLTQSALLVSVSAFAFYVSNFIRMKTTGLVLTPNDFTFLGKFDEITGFLSIRFDIRYVLSVVTILTALLLLRKYEKSNEKLQLNKINKRIIICSVTGLFFILMFFVPVFQYNVYGFVDVSTKDFQKSRNYLYGKYGDLFGFYLVMQEKNNNHLIPRVYKGSHNSGELSSIRMLIDPEFYKTYSEEYMTDSFSGYIPTYPPEESIKPNVIVIMSEAFWDPSVLQNVIISGGITENFKKLAEEGVSGKIITPSLGGTTCNPEYELLTGRATFFAGQRVVPYELPDVFFNEPDNFSLPFQFKQNGYKSVAVHSFKRDFYNRDMVYEKLSFDEFISMEDMDDAPLSGGYISDDYFMKKTAEIIENTDEPLFLFGITMENHYPYLPDKYEVYTIDVISDSIDEIQASNLRAYAQGIKNADQSLCTLVESVRASGEPTIIMFFGDHLPLIGEEPLEFYKNTELISSSTMADWNASDKYNAYSTPYLVWSNFNCDLSDFDDMSPYFAGAKLLDASGLQMNGYFSFLLDAGKHFKGLNSEIYINDDGKAYDYPIVQDQKILEKFYQISFDINGSFENGGNRFTEKFLIPNK